MSKKGSKHTDVVAGARSAANLAQDLADRERQLRDLTEQALGFLEELAESRRLNGDRDQLAGRIGELERTLADVRQRLRHAGGCVAAATPLPTGSRAALAVVFWGSDAFAEATAASALGGEVPVAWVGAPAAVPAKGMGGALQTIVHRDARTEAQCWNVAMAATAAEYVLLLGPGARLLRAPSVPEAVPPSAAVLCPRIDRNKSLELGCEESDELLRLRSRVVTAGGDAMTAVPWPAAQAFVVRRAAFERIGLFDEGLVGSAALLDYTLRARQQNFDIFGAPGLAVAAAALPSAIESPDDERMRLLVLATYRPDQLGKALAETQMLWTLGAEAPGFLAQLLARLPAADGLAAQRAVLDQICVGLIAKAMPATDVAGRVAAARTVLLRAFAAADLPGKDELAAALRDCESSHEVQPAAAFDALARDIALCARLAAAAASAAQQIRAELRALDVERHAHMARAEQAEGARGTTQAQLDQVQRWLVESRQELRQAHEARHEVGQQVDQVRGELSRSQQQLDPVRAELALAQQQLRAAAAAQVERERESRELRHELDRMASIAGLSDAADRVALHDRLTELHDVSRRFATTLEAAGASDEAALLAKLDALGQRLVVADRTIDEREQWIVALLDEVRRRRLFPRELFAHERALIERMRRAP